MTTTTTTYQGWKNYPTWAINLWLENDHGSYSHWTERASEALSKCEGDKEEAARLLSGLLKDEHEEAASSALPNGILSEVLGWALEQVDWREIAASWMEGASCDEDGEGEDDGE